MQNCTQNPVQRTKMALGVSGRVVRRPSDIRVAI
jgi:hypothetical protein